MPSIKCIGRMSVLLDYYPSAQFAGIHVANRMGLYLKRGLDVELLPPPGAGGDEPQLVCNLQRAFDKDGGGCTGAVPRLAVGTVEQNVLIPAVARGVPGKAFATLFQSSPLALASLPGSKLSSAADLCGRRIGMHVDSLELMASLVSLSGFSTSILQVQRATKVQELVDGKVDAIQIYDCMEAIELQHLLQQEPSILRLADMVQQTASSRRISLGYSQVLFGGKWALRPPAARAALTAFLEATAEGWLLAKSDSAAAAAAVVEDRAALEAEQGSVVDSPRFQEEALLRCLPYVLSDEVGQDRVGSIDAGVWQEASLAMAITGYASELVPQCISLDSTLWPAVPVTGGKPTSHKPALVVDGLEVSRSMRAEAAIRAAAFEARVGRKPCLAIVTVGTGHPHGAQRKRLFGGDASSWFDKAELCKGAGIEPVNVRLADTASFAAVHDSIQALNRRADIDAIVLERPVPAGLDADVLGSYIYADKDVDNERRSSEYADGGAFMSNQGIFQASHDLQLDLSSVGHDEVLARPPRPPWLCRPPAVLPCTVEGILQLLHRSGLMDTVVPNGLTVVVGRSPQLGAPLARQLLKADGTVAVCHSGTDVAQMYLDSIEAAVQLRQLCRQADCLIAAAGSPGLITNDMVKPGALVINCGTTYCPTQHKLLPDVADDVAQVAAYSTPTPHGVGPTCAAALTLNTLTLAEAAARRRELEMRHKSGESVGFGNEGVSHTSSAAEVSPEGGPAADALPSPWWERGVCPQTGSPLLRRTFTCASFRAAADLIADMTVLAERANHHPTLAVNPARKCEMEGGCDVVVELSSYSAGAVTRADLHLAQRFDCLASAACVSASPAA